MFFFLGEKETNDSFMEIKFYTKKADQKRANELAKY